jgi:hypothetical protein
MLTMNRLVIGKLERFVEATRLLGQGSRPPGRRGA